MKLDAKRPRTRRLQKDAQPGAVPNQHFARVSSPTAEQEQVAARRIATETRLHQSEQPVVPLAQLDWLRIREHSHGATLTEDHPISAASPQPHRSKDHPRERPTVRRPKPHALAYRRDYLHRNQLTRAQRRRAETPAANRLVLLRELSFDLLPTRAVIPPAQCPRHHARAQRNRAVSSRLQRGSPRRSEGGADSARRTKPKQGYNRGQRGRRTDLSRQGERLRVTFAAALFDRHQLSRRGKDVGNGQRSEGSAATRAQLPQIVRTGWGEMSRRRRGA
jgi:hypothetical protein